MSGGNSPRIGIPYAPTPLPQLSSNVIVGGDEYIPGVTMSTPIIFPNALRTALPVAPEPEPPQKTTLGGPQDSGPVKQSPPISKFGSIAKLKFDRFSGILITPTALSTIPLAELNMLVKSKENLDD